MLIDITFDLSRIKMQFDPVGHVWVKFPYNPSLIAEIKQLKDSDCNFYEWQPDYGYWIIYTWEGWVLPKLFELLSKYYPRKNNVPS